jgi:hypothetical protein
VSLAASAAQAFACVPVYGHSTQYISHLCISCAPSCVCVCVCSVLLCICVHVSHMYLDCVQLCFAVWPCCALACMCVLLTNSSALASGALTDVLCATGDVTSFTV